MCDNMNENWRSLYKICQPQNDKQQHVVQFVSVEKMLTTGKVRAGSDREKLMNGHEVN